MAMVLSASDLTAARRLAEAAADELERGEDRPTADRERGGSIAHYATPAVSHALARVGLTERRSRLFGRVRLEDSAELSPTLVAALWELSPDAAEDMARVLERQLADSPHSDQRIRGYVELLVAVGHRTPERGLALREALRRELAEDDPVFRFLFGEIYVAAALLVAGTGHGSSQRPGQADTDADGPRALIHAARGEYEQAEALVAGLYREREGPAARAAMAATIAGLPWRPWLEQGELALTRGCIELTLPRPSADADRIARAREQLRKVLVTEHWYEALPVLAELDPGALRPVRDVVFAHLGIEVDAADETTVSPEPRPLPPPAPA